MANDLVQWLIRFRTSNNKLILFHMYAYAIHDRNACYVCAKTAIENVYL